VSDNVTDLLGFTVSETLSYEWWVGQLHPDDREQAIGSIGATLSKGTSCTTYRIGTKDGRYRWVEDNRRVIRDSSGNPTEIVGVWTDITARIALEAGLALREQQLAAFFSGATVGLAVFDTALRCVRLNDTMARMNGFPAADHIGKAVTEIVPRLASQVVPIFQKVLTTGEPILDIEIAGETPGQPNTLRHWVESFFSRSRLKREA
jgi:two-component system sensor histidine kinase/response regulator